MQIKDPTIYFKSSEHMKEIDDNSIQLIITSPPYGKIKDYGTKTQIGFSDSFEDYFTRLKRVWSECYRVLEPQCRIAINVGDQYLRASEFGRYRILSIASRIINDCLSLGFDFLGDIIWQKVSTTNTTGGCSLMGSIYYPRNGLLTYDYEHILIFKKHKGIRRKIDRRIKEMSKISLSEWKKWFVGHWRVPGVIQKEHVAMFPDEIPYRLIRMFSFIGDTVLDPFLGSGTTLKIAKLLFRNGIGYEINNDFKDLIRKKLNEDKFILDYQYLNYKLLELSKKGQFRILFDLQKQKGVIFLENQNKCKIVIDYLLLEDQIRDDNKIFEEINLKLQENTMKRYFDGNGIWNDMKNYVIILNLKFGNLPDDFKQKVRIYTEKYKKSVMFIQLNKLINMKSISKLFLNK